MTPEQLVEDEVWPKDLGVDHDLCVLAAKEALVKIDSYRRPILVVNPINVATAEAIAAKIPYPINITTDPSLNCDSWYIEWRGKIVWGHK